MPRLMRSLFFKIVFVALAALVIVNFVCLQVRINAKSAELEQLRSQLEELKSSISQKQYLLEHGEQDIETYERIARTLDLEYPGARVYINLDK